MNETSEISEPTNQLSVERDDTIGRLSPIGVSVKRPTSNTDRAGTATSGISPSGMSWSGINLGPGSHADF